MGEVHRVVADLKGERLDRFLAIREEGMSRAQIAGLVARGLVTVDGTIAKASHRLKVGEVVEMVVSPPPPTTLTAQDIPLTVVYEDEDVLVVDKPAGMVVHPAPGHPLGTLVNALLSRLSDLDGVGEEMRPGIVHRLDKDTSGLIVVAKNSQAHRYVSQQMKERAVHKVYIALVKGNMQPPEGIIRGSIGRDDHNRKRMAIVDGGREAETGYRVVERFPGYTLVEASPKTGRTHQIRVHFSSLGYSLVGDILYGGKAPILDRQFLHARTLGFRLPGSGVYMEFYSPLPPELETVLAGLRGDDTAHLSDKWPRMLAERR